MVVVLAACEPLPPLDYESEHALVGSDEVERVCAGSLARIDWTIEYVDEQLGRETDSRPVTIYVLSRTEIVKYCDYYLGGCVRDGTVFMSKGAFDGLTHEIVHERLSRVTTRTPTPLVNEGLAVSIGSMHAAPSEDSPRAAAGSYIAAKSSAELREFPYAYYYAGELMSWLVETQGMPAVLEFARDVDKRHSAAEVRAAYAAHFDRDLDLDLFVHVREDADLTRANLKCTGPEIVLDSQRRRVRLEADLDCSSPRVENLWVRRDRVFVEWVVEIDEESRGYWAPVRSEGDNAIPEDTLLEIVRCRREHRSRDRWTPTNNAAVLLEPGLYRIRWSGPMDGDARLDLELGGPCDPVAQDCEAGEYCAEPGVCVPKN